MVIEIHTKNKDLQSNDANDCTNINCENPILCYSLYVKKVGSVFLPVWKYHKFSDQFIAQVYPQFKQNSSQKRRSMLASQIDIQGSEMDLVNN